MKKLHLISSICVLTLGASIAGCGGSSDSQSDSTGGSIDGSPTPSGEVLTGSFVDSPVSGLSYRTETRSGVTNTNGEFTYRAGETVVFGLGDIQFPAVEAAQILTPLDLAGVSDINDTGVVNMARLLQSLDRDCNPDNGIIISGEALLSAAGMTLNFEDPEFDSKVVNLVANGGQQNSACKTLIDETQAVAHLQETLNSLNNQNEPPIGGGLTGKLGVWEGVGQQSGVSWTIRINIQETEQSIEYPSLNCGGTLDLIEETEAQLIFEERITFGRQTCVNEGIVELTDQSENELVFRYWEGLDLDFGAPSAVGNLTRVE